MEPRATSCHAVACPPPASSGCATISSAPVRVTVGAGLAVYPAGGGLFHTGSARGLTATAGTNAHAKPSSPADAVTSTTSTGRLLWTNARTASEPAAVVIVPRSSAFQTSSRQSTPVTAPTGVSVRCPIGSRARPNSEPNSGRWSCTWLCWTLNRTAFAPGSA